MVPANQLTQHEEQECPHRQVECEYCGGCMIWEAYQVSQTFTNPRKLKRFERIIIIIIIIIIIRIIIIKEDT